MKTDLDFENPETKKLLSKLEFKFFLEQHINNEEYRAIDIEDIYSKYVFTAKLLKEQSKSNKKQFTYFTEGKVRRMFTGGFLPALFELDKSRTHHFLDFSAIGENWAYFDFWQKRYRRKLTKAKLWEFTTKSGSILAIILSIIKLLEHFTFI